MKPLPNRLAVYVTAAGALAAGLLPLVGNLDWESTAGILGAIVAITGVVSIWLYNWGKYERREDAIGDADLDDDDLETEFDDELDDEFDEATAEPVPPAVAELAHTPEGSRLATPADLELEHGTPGTGSPPPGPRPARPPERP